MKYIIIFSVALGLGRLSTVTSVASNYSPITTADSTSSDSVQIDSILNSLVDYVGFGLMVQEVDPIRQKHLIGIDTFLAYAEDSSTIVLDTRSKQAYDELHVAGAVHLNFSDFTASKLKKVIPDANTRVLIYCNNNFLDNVAPMVLKSLPLALNIPTFINLHGYGYTNVYELSGADWFSKSRFTFEGTKAKTLVK